MPSAGPTPTRARQYGMDLDGRLTLQKRRRFTSSGTRDIEQLRAKYTVMENMWLLAQLQQPGRAMYRDLTASTFTNFLKVLLNKRNFSMSTASILGTKQTRLKLWEEHLKDPVTALDKALKCVENQNQG